MGLTVNYQTESSDKMQLGYEKIIFSSSQYQKMMKQLMLEENYLQFIDIVEMEFFDLFSKSLLPLMMKETYVFKKASIQTGKTHIVFMVHGLEGNSCDMRTIRSILSYLCPKTIFILSEGNEENTQENIEKMGERLAFEVEELIQFYGKGKEICLSFIGHSLGGLIIRACIPFLTKFKNQLHTLITLGTPHLGSSSKKVLVRLGMKVLSSFEKQKSLKEMCLQDQNGYLMRLSQQEGLSWFRNLVLVSSYNDGYVNYESAKIIYENQSQPNKMFEEMAKNIYRGIDPEKVVKLTFYQPNMGLGFDKYLG